MTPTAPAAGRRTPAARARVTGDERAALARQFADDYTGGVKRTVVIDGVDRNP